MTTVSEPWADDAPIRIGVSSCLIGREVRFDGGHKHARFLTDAMGPFVEFVPVCPEVEVGMGIPRETVRLVRSPSAIRMIAERSGTDHTDTMHQYARKRVQALARLGLCGYVLKKDSPSCGMERVRVYDSRSRIPERNGRGLFAAELMRRLSRLPVEEEGRLNDPPLRENFVERVFAYRRLQTFFAGRWTVASLIGFHTRHKLQLLSHSPAEYRTLGRLVAGAKGRPRADVRDEYADAFMRALTRKATVRRHYNVLQHMLGYFRGSVEAADREELRRVCDDYFSGLVPLIVPITLIRHHVRRSQVSYLDGQVYLEPHPKELMLRNHV